MKVQAYELEGGPIEKLLPKYARRYYVGDNGQVFVSPRVLVKGDCTVMQVCYMADDVHMVAHKGKHYIPTTWLRQYLNSLLTQEQMEQAKYDNALEGLSMFERKAGEAGE